MEFIDFLIIIIDGRQIRDWISEIFTFFKDFKVQSFWYEIEEKFDKNLQKIL